MNPTPDPIVVRTLSAVCSHPGCPERVRERLSSILMTGVDPGMLALDLRAPPLSETWYLVEFWALRTFLGGLRPIDKSLYSENTLQTLARVHEPDHP